MSADRWMTDWHCHLLPGLDDGPETEAESLAMARALTAAGFRRVCCTPHAIRGVYDNRPAGVRGAVRQLQQRLMVEGVELVLYPGMEYCLDEFLLDNLADPLLLPGNLMLVEIPQRSDRQLVVETLRRLIRSKVVPLIAHPERCELLAPPESSGNGLIGRVGRLFKTPFTGKHAHSVSVPLLDELQMTGCLFQGNLGSFAGIYGARVRSRAEKFLTAGIYSHFGSDLHSLRQTEILAVRQRLSMERK